MPRKSVLTLLSVIFTGSIWYMYSLYPFTSNLIFAILVTTITIVNLTRLYMSKMYKGDKDPINTTDVVRYLVTIFGTIMFITFFVFSMRYGGSYESDEDARERYENYVEGSYYVSNHNRFTEVTYEEWQTVRTIEFIALPSFAVMFVWNFVHGVKTKGWKYMATGKE